MTAHFAIEPRAMFNFELNGLVEDIEDIYDRVKSRRQAITLKAGGNTADAYTPFLNAANADEILKSQNAQDLRCAITIYLHNNPQHIDALALVTDDYRDLALLMDTDWPDYAAYRTIYSEMTRRGVPAAAQKPA